MTDEVTPTLNFTTQQSQDRLERASRAVRPKHSRVAGIVLPIDAADTEVMSNPFVLEFLQAMRVALEQINYGMLVIQNKSIDPTLWQTGVVDGFIQLGHGVEPWRLNLLPPEMPLVIWGPQLQGQHYCSVGIDNIALARQAVEHLFESGRRRVGILVGGFGNRDTESYFRYLGYAKALQSFGIPFDSAALVYTDFDLLSGYSATEILLGQAPYIDAIFAAHSDVVAMASINTLISMGRRVPEDIAVVGFDNIALGQNFHVPLTTVSQELFTVGVTVLAERLMAQLAGQPSPSGVIEGKLVIRRSCGAVMEKIDKG